MTQKEVRKRNVISFVLLGAVFVGLGIYDLQAGKATAGIAYFIAGSAAAALVLAGILRRGKNGGEK
ncbi:hypothetical protein [Thermocaproicibacter melissae]|uniref:hypothetical protein n=1 Tax=Thermocaproicibacter melissae TaxID=2966552 RepID=UPI0024B19A2B|nr:hypothetical protein [Thermocaproicibacter melissae]WBY63635.1 hypothetical protein NOG13_06605 [Thermocaproicibacter melissae]